MTNATTIPLPLRASIMVLAVSLAVFGVLGATHDVAAQEPCVWCSDCNYLGDVGNIAGGNHPFAANTEGKGVHEDECVWTGDCDDQHPGPCGQTEEEQQQFAADVRGVQEALAAGNALGAYRIAMNEGKGSRLFFSPGRLAIQGRACNDSVVLHIPLGSFATPELLAAIDHDWGRRQAPHTVRGVLLRWTTSALSHLLAPSED